MRPDSLCGTPVRLPGMLLAMLPLVPACASQPATVPPAASQKGAADSLQHLRIEIRTADGRHWFNVSLADTEALQEKGLMFVRSLPEDTGMLFPQRVPRTMSMWMKNTLIPLDMLFIDGAGKIVCLREKAVPESLEIISCDQPVMEVLEIAGGQSAQRHIAVGDTVSHAAPTPANPIRR
jgi:uncharacterized membrane protein (UPF0127 family)